MNCRHESTCLNYGKCLRCQDEMLYKPNQKARIKSMSKPKAEVVSSSDDDSWKDLEQKVADALNKIPEIKEAHRSLASGALWFQKGDVIDEILHPEAKERIGNEIASGADKSISIKKSWLDKAREEAIQTFKTMCLPFRFKSDDHIYMIFRLDDIAELVVNMKSIMFENRQLKTELEVIKKELKGGPNE